MENHNQLNEIDKMYPRGYKGCSSNSQRVCEIGHL